MFLAGLGLSREAEPENVMIDTRLVDIIRRARAIKRGEVTPDVMRDPIFTNSDTLSVAPERYQPSCLPPVERELRAPIRIQDEMISQRIISVMNISYFDKSC